MNGCPHNVVGPCSHCAAEFVAMYTPANRAPAGAFRRQEGGEHYKDQAIQPVEYIHANGIGYFEGNVIKYVTRWRQKGGIEDLKKAQHYLEMLIELEMAKE